MRPPPAVSKRRRAQPDRRDRVRQLCGGRYAAITGHCIYCGAFSRGRLCSAHQDLPPIDPAFAPTITALAR
jgi:hypothetical protein